MSKLLPILLIGMASASSGKKTAPEPTEKGVLAIAAKHSKTPMLGLGDADQEAVENIKKEIEAAGDKEEKRKIALDNVINSLSLSLASNCSRKGISAAAAYLVSQFPRDRRALNLLGAVLHTLDEYADSIAVYEYGLSLHKDDLQLRLNLAICYLDADQDQKSFLILDRLRYEDADNRSVWKALAAYYYKQKDWGRFRECLLKSATFKGYRQKKTKEKIEKVEKEEVKREDTKGEMERKLKELVKVVPLSTADILEVDYPDVAEKVREHWGKLHEGEWYFLPTLPQANFNSPREYAVSQPIAEAWVEAALQNLTDLRMMVYKAKGIDPNAPEEVIEQQGLNAAMNDMAGALQAAQQAMQMMQGMNIPGMDPQQMEMIKSQMEQVTRQFGVEKKPVDRTTLPGFDTGSMFSQGNWSNYQRIFNSYLAYLEKYWDEYDTKTKDIFDQYVDKVRPENESWNEEYERLQEEHKDIYLCERHSDTDEPCRRSKIQHKRRLNAFADNYYTQWESLFFFEYPQKMKPYLEGFFNISMLYVRNMSDPDVMLKEYQRVIESFAKYAEKAVIAIGGGAAFSFYPEVEEEEMELEADKLRSREEAIAKMSGFISDWPPPEKGYTDWIADNFVLEVGIDVLAMKLTAHNIEIRFQVPGVFSGVKYDFENEKLSSYTGIGLKADFGLNICGKEIGKLSVGGEAIRRTATWELQSGKYYETDTAKAEVGLSNGPLKFNAELNMDSQLHAKVKAKATVTAKDDKDTSYLGETSQWEWDLW